MTTDNLDNRYESDLRKDNYEKDPERAYENDSKEDNGLAQGEPDTFSDDGYKIDWWMLYMALIKKNFVCSENAAGKIDSILIKNMDNNNPSWLDKLKLREKF